MLLCKGHQDAFLLTLLSHITCMPKVVQKVKFPDVSYFQNNWEETPEVIQNGLWNNPCVWFWQLKFCNGFPHWALFAPCDNTILIYYQALNALGKKSTYSQSVDRSTISRWSLKFLMMFSHWALFSPWSDTITLLFSTSSTVASRFRSLKTQRIS